MFQLGEIDRADPRPPYQQIAAMLRSAVETGELEPGVKLPSEAALIEHFGVARMTARQAIQELRGEGLVIAEHGRGVFVRPMPPVRRLASDRFARKHRDEGKAAFLAEADKTGYQPGVDRIKVRRGAAPKDAAERLRLDPDAEVVIRDRRYLANGRPVETATSYLPLSLVEGTEIEQPDPGPGGIYARLEDHGHALEHFTEEVASRMPTPDERAALEIGPGVPVLTVVRTAYDTADTAVEVCDTVKAAPAYVLEYDFPAR